MSGPRGFADLKDVGFCSDDLKGVACPLFLYLVPFGVWAFSKMNQCLYFVCHLSISVQPRSASVSSDRNI